MIVLAFPGMAPAAKARPRVTGNGTYMPHKYQDWRRRIVWEIRWGQAKWAEKRTIIGPIGVSITYRTASGNMRPDIDNAAGAVLDALQEAWVIDNDSQVRRLSAEVVKAKKADCGITVTIEALPDVPSVARKAAKGRLSTRQPFDTLNTSN